MIFRLTLAFGLFVISVTGVVVAGMAVHSRTVPQPVPRIAEYDPCQDVACPTDPRAFITLKPRSVVSA